MADILDEASALLECKECPWYKACLLPMRFSMEDVRKQMEAMPGQGIGGPGDPGTNHMLAGMVSAAQNSLLEGCPVLVRRLKASQKLSERIKKIMQEWASEGENPGA